jgi:esterase
MKLYHREFGGQGFPIVILHGLFASSKNWVSVGKFLSSRGRSFAVDLRNHGDSPHADSHTLADLVGDLHEWLSDQHLERPVIIGHSMGGLAAMAYSLSRPAALRGLVVVDIAPRPYRPDFEREFAALSLDIGELNSRAEIDQALQAIVPDPEVRQFLQMNAERSDGGFRWKLNVPVLKASPFMDGPDFGRFRDGLSGQSEVPALLVVGGESEFVREEDIPLFKGYFPQGSVKVIPGCGHWLHYVCSNGFQEMLASFLSGL